MKWKVCVQVFIICWSAVAVSSIDIAVERQDINLSNDGGYTDILIAIDESVPDNPDIITKLKEYFTEASEVLLTATKNQMYFKSLTILVPPQWPSNPERIQPESQETFDKARILIHKANLQYGNVPYTNQYSKTCGQEGLFSHFTPEYLTNKNSDHLPFKPAKRIVREFAHLRWGLFDEDVPFFDTETNRFYMEDDVKKAFSCKAEANYRPMNVLKCIESLKCNIIFTGITGNTSLMSADYLDEVTEFCTKENHNTNAKNRQNTNCESRSAWEVMSSLPDFNSGTVYTQNRNEYWTSEPVFRIVQEIPPTTTPGMTLGTTPLSSTTTLGWNNTLECEQDIVCLCLDTSGSMSRFNRIGIMSASVQRYIKTYLREGAAVGIVGFNSSAFVYADMTEMDSEYLKGYLSSKVPTIAGGGTNIGAGILECRRILQSYAGESLDRTRILLLSDGDGDLGDSISTIVGDGITMDTILYGQGGYLVNKTVDGKENLASDEKGKSDLTQFFAESASRGCGLGNSAAVLENENIEILAEERLHRGVVGFDATIGLDTKLVFQYSDEVDVSISDEQNLTVTLDRDFGLKTIIAVVHGKVTGNLEYVITKSADLNITVTVVVTVTSFPVPGITPIAISHKVNDDDITFDPSIQIIGYVAVFQGLTPVLDLKVTIDLEQPNKVERDIICVDDGTGQDAKPNDGIYTGFLPAHLIGGSSSGSYYGLTIKISGEGKLPGEGSNSRRRKRCVDCNSLGNITRSNSGGVVVINNWYQVEDTTPPERITDLSVLDATEDNVFTLGWTAPGDDLNIGTVSGYEFTVGSNVSIESHINLVEEAISSNISALLVNSGNRLELVVNASKITPEMLGLDQSTNISTYYFRMRTFDAKNNFADWSNPAFASYVDPAAFSPGTTPQPETTKSDTAIYFITIPPAYETPLIIIAALVSGLIVIAAIAACACCCRSKRSSSYMISRP